MKNVVLIGASGFVGTAILNELLNRGHKVTACTRPDQSDRQQSEPESRSGRCDRYRCSD